jgi:hypothetical protein
MSPWAAFKVGTGKIRLHKRLVLWLYLANAVFAATLVFPLRSVIAEISKTDLAAEFTSGFPFDVFLGIWPKYSSAFKSLGLAALSLGVLYLALNIFLMGGIVATMAGNQRISFRRFLHSASRYFLRFLRLSILMVVVLGCVVAAYAVWGQPIVTDQVKNATTDVASFMWRAGGIAVVLVFVSVVIMVFDYAKIRTVIDSRRSMFVATLVGLGFSLRRILRTISLFYLNLALVALLFAIYLLVESRFSNATTASMAGLFIVQQLFVLGRIWMRLSFFATQTAFYQAATVPSPSLSTIEAAPTPEPEVVPNGRVAHLVSRWGNEDGLKSAVGSSCPPSPQEMGHPA